MEMIKKRLSLLHPINIAIILGFALLRLMTYLPASWLFAAGRLLGRMAYHVTPKTRRIIRTNLAICFPEWSSVKREEIVKANYQSMGQALFETAYGWFGIPHPILEQAEIKNFDIFTGHVEHGGAAILLGLHMSAVELIGATAATAAPFSVVYQQAKNPIVNRIMQKQRAYAYANTLPSDNIREIVRELRRGRAIWFGPDLNPRKAQRVFAPFFNVPARSSTSMARLAKMANAKVIPMVYYRDTAGHYHMEALPPLEDFPTDDPQKDAARLNQCFESTIRAHPEQYLWSYPRFKHRPNKGPNPYKSGIITASECYEVN